MSASVTTAAPSAGDKPSFNDQVLFWASFLTLIAAGIGFSVRGSILGDWGRQFGFTQGELGTITGGGLIGFGFSIIFFSFLADRIGYGRLMVIAFLLHLSSAIVTLAASWVYGQYGKDATFYCLNAGMWLFALGNGTCEAVINPLTASLYPKNKTHWLNILHAGWPGGLVLGAVLGLIFNQIGNVPWEVQIGMFLVPTLAYGIMMLGRTFPKSEASKAGVSVGTMMLEFLSPILLFLVVLHAMVGYVELGTDSWIINITETILANKDQALIAFIWTNVLMFALRFFAGPIVHKISPLGLLLVSACLGTGGLLLLGQVNTAMMWMVAVTIYGIGKTFFWPTMLGVVSERFPKGGALTLGVVGGVGMLSAGFLGGPGIGYKQDIAAVAYLTEKKETASYDRYKSGEPKGFLFFDKVDALDNAKVGTLLGKPGQDNGMGKLLEQDIKNVEAGGRKLSDVEGLNKLNTWWQSAKEHAKEDKGPIDQAMLYGAQKSLTWTAAVPATMAIGYLILLIYFMAIGGYKAEELVGHAAEDEKYTGGTQGPGEG